MERSLKDYRANGNGLFLFYLTRKTVSQQYGKLVYSYSWTPIKKYAQTTPSVYGVSSFFYCLLYYIGTTIWNALKKQRSVLSSSDDRRLIWIRVFDARIQYIIFDLCNNTYLCVRNKHDRHCLFWIVASVVTKPRCHAAQD
jgi:hypothetical protein